MKQTDNIPAGYKSSPLGIIPKDWEVKRLGELFVFKNGINSGKDNYGQGVKFVNTMDVLGNSFMSYGSLRGSVLVSDVQQKEFSVMNGDVLFNRTSETREEVGFASVYIDNKIAVFGGFIIRAHSLDNSININFKKYCFQPQYIRNQISSFGNGAIRYNLGQEDLTKVLLLLPPLPEQQKIAEILSGWDSAIEKQSALIEKLETRKRGLMQQLLTCRGESHSPTKRLKGFSGEWKKVKAEDVFIEVTTPNDGMHNYPAMTISSKQGLVPQQNKFDRVIAGNSLGKYILLQKNDFAYNKGNSKTYPMGCIFKLVTHDNALVPFVYICFRKAIQISNEFYEQWFSNHGLDRQLKRIITSGARGDGLLNVDSRDFFRLIIPLPKIEEQTAIAKILTTADDEIALAKQKLESLRQQKKGLMQVLLTGKKRVKI